MAVNHGDIQRHAQYLLKVPQDVVVKKMEFFRLNAEVIDNLLPFICLADTISDKYAKWRRFIHPLDPITLEDLKNWFGTPNEAAKRQLQETRTITAGGHLLGPVTRVTDPRIPRDRFVFKRLEPEQQVAVRNLATNLLYGYVDPETLKQPHVASVVDYMLERAKATKVKIFVGTDLIVCPDDEVIFEGLAAVYFNNILIYGTGQISTRSDTKFHAQQIQHV